MRFGCLPSSLSFAVALVAEAERAVAGDGALGSGLSGCDEDVFVLTPVWGCGAVPVCAAQIAVQTATQKNMCAIRRANKRGSLQLGVSNRGSLLLDASSRSAGVLTGVGASTPKVTYLAEKFGSSIPTAQPAGRWKSILRPRA